MTKQRVLNQNELDALRLSVEGSIRKAFAHVRRTGGVSWSEADVIDDYGTAEQRAKAQLLDKDTTWEQLIDDPRWDANDHSANFTFLDPIGKRYYLPALMIRAMRKREAFDLRYSLDSPPEFLNDAQASATARYLHFMWQKALSEEQSFLEQQGYSITVESSHWAEFFAQGWKSP